MDKTISQLTELLSAPASNDLFVVVDVSDTTDSLNGTTKKITRANLAAGSWFKETPTGALDGSNLSYTLTHIPIASSGTLSLGGQILTEGSDYNYSSVAATLTMLSPVPAGYAGAFKFQYQYVT